MLGTDDDAPPRRFSGGRQGRDRRGRGGVLDVSVPGGRKSQELCCPVESQKLELGRGGRGAPEERHGIERCSEQLGEDSGLGGAVRKVGEEARTLPVRDSR